MTGTTGSLGARVLAQLASNPRFNTIYCLVRATNDAEALQRVQASLVQRRLYHCMPLSFRRKIVALAADLADSSLGLSDDIYTSIQGGVLPP